MTTLHFRAYKLAHFQKWLRAAPGTSSGGFLFSQPRTKARCWDMDQPNTSTDHLKDQQALRERLARLEERVQLGSQYDRSANYQAWSGLQMQMDELRAEVRLRGYGQPLGSIAWFKILAAVLLPYLALLLTGSIEFAHKVAAVPGL